MSKRTCQATYVRECVIYPLLFKEVINLHLMAKYTRVHTSVPVDHRLHQ